MTGLSGDRSSEIFFAKRRGQGVIFCQKGFLKERNNMEEIFELRACIEEGRYTDAIVLLGEMEEMGRDDKINKIESFLEILLLRLIKQHAEKRTTRSWETSIFNSVYQINKINRRRKSGGYYLKAEEIGEAIEESYPAALKHAAIEAFEGILDDAELAGKVDETRIKEEALDLILKACNQQGGSNAA